MRLRNVKNASEIIDNCSYLILNPFLYRGEWKTVFGNENPIHLEIGMGKGQFLLEMARNNPMINFIGVEKYDSIVARAILKIGDNALNNLRIIKMDASLLNEVFNHEISVIYLNFSDPWPKSRHAKRRLSSHEFLKIYDDIFGNDKKIIQKTDNISLFESSIISFSTYGYVIEDISLDLDGSPRNNVRTEYENKFISKNVKINYLVVHKK